MKLISVFQSESVPVLTVPFTVFAPAGIWGSAPVLTTPFTVFALAGMWGSAPVLTIPFTVFAPAGMWGSAQPLCSPSPSQFLLLLACGQCLLGALTTYGPQ